jgi:hypothetical protein
MMRVDPRELVEVISLTPAMRPSERSSGVATEEAMVSGEAPGREADTIITGKSTCGSGATGRQQAETQYPGQRNRQRQQCGGYWPMDEQRKELHDGSSV